MLKTYEAKMYPTATQDAALSSWLRTCCWLYNQALEQRIKAYKRRGERVTYNMQSAWLTDMRSRVERVRSVPLYFTRAASLTRLDRAMQAFFRRCKAGERSGFPRFKAERRFHSLEMIHLINCLHSETVRVPKLGKIKIRGGHRVPEGQQKVLRIIRRPSGWYCQVVVDDGRSDPKPKKIKSLVGIDVGLINYAALSTGEKIENPRWTKRSERKLRALQRRVSRRQKRSKRRRRAVRALARHHERVAAQRRNFTHQLSTDLVRKYDLIGVENLNIKGMARSRFSKSILDASWGTFMQQLEYKAASAGTRLVKVDPKHTSRTCPDCGRIRPKPLSERVHRCPCGCILDRDVAASRVILARALKAVGVNRTLRNPTTGSTRTAKSIRRIVKTPCMSLCL